MLRVLAVDDLPDTTTSLAMLLELWGHEPCVASDGPTALAKAALAPPDVAFVDIGLPGLNGFEVARKLRALPGMADALLVAVTGHATEEDRRKARDAGFDLLLAKPADPFELE